MRSPLSVPRAQWESHLRPRRSPASLNAVKAAEPPRAGGVWLAGVPSRAGLGWARLGSPGLDGSPSGFRSRPAFTSLPQAHSASSLSPSLEPPPLLPLSLAHPAAPPPLRETLHGVHPDATGSPSTSTCSHYRVSTRCGVSQGRSPASGLRVVLLVWVQGRVPSTLGLALPSRRLLGSG